MDSTERDEPGFPPPERGASLLLAFKPISRIFLIIGGASIAANRALAALEADQEVVVLVKGGAAAACDELRWRAGKDELEIVDTDSIPSVSSSTRMEHDTAALEAYIASSTDVALVCITDTVLGSPKARSKTSARRIYDTCHARNILVNATDIPELCDFSFTATHRFVESSSGKPSPLQVGVTTNGQGCRLSTRIRRDIVAALPKSVGGAVSNIGELRSRAKTKNASSSLDLPVSMADSTPNTPVPQTLPKEEAAEDSVHSTRRRMRWIAQMSEFWPMSCLAQLTDDEMTAALSNPAASEPASSTSGGTRASAGTSSQHLLEINRPGGKILLIGSGPGHPGLLTVATHLALTQHADLVLSDKLVPAQVLDLIPSHVEVRIARKFPGNADGAQNELMQAAVEGAKQGKTVVRLKQGDPSVYGRAGEEILHFRAHGFEPLVIPGVSSALAAPTFANIPVTQRGVAESLIICTGVGRAGKAVRLPGYLRSQTLVLLMGVARLPTLVDALCAQDVPQELGRRRGRCYPKHLPIAIVERASMPDQRVLTSTLSDVCAALESAGEQRPPGMIVVGWAVLALWGKGDVEVLEDGPPEDEEIDEESGGYLLKDKARVLRWLGDRKWRIQEGIDPEWTQFGFA